MEKPPLLGKPWKIKRIFLAVLTFILWLGTSVVGLVVAFLTRQTAVRIYASFDPDVRPASLLGSVLFILLMLVWLTYVIASGEFHMKHFAQPRSWKIIAMGIGVEVVLLILYLFVL